MTQKQTVKKKPRKPRPDFPLFPHASGQWAKKIKGRLIYFGAWTDPDAALNKYLDEKDELQAGRTPTSRRRAGLTVRDLANHYLTWKSLLVDTGELSDRTFAGYHRACGLVVDHFGDRLVEDVEPADFTALRSVISNGRGVVAIGNMVHQARMMFLDAMDEGLTEKHIRFGKAFKEPSRKSKRVSRQKKQQEHGKRMLEAADLRRVIDECGVHLRAQVFLGANCGFGNTDVAKLPLSAVDLDRGWIDFPRPKTSVERRCPLWPETVTALRESLEKRPTPKSEEHAGLVFITKYGNPWVRHVWREKDDGKFRLVCFDRVANEFAKVLTRLDLKRPGLNFYCLRHGFETVGSGAKDQTALNFLMGHADESMAGVYREGIEDERLVAVTNHVHAWLLPHLRKPR